MTPNRPPSVIMQFPFKYAPARLVKYNTAPAISSADPVLCNGIMVFGIPCTLAFSISGPSVISEGYTRFSLSVGPSKIMRNRRQICTSWSNHIGSNIIWHKRGGELLHHMCRPRFRCSVGKSCERHPVVSPNTGYSNELTQLLYVLFLVPLGQ